MWSMPRVKARAGESPVPVLETERLILRPLRAGDAPQFLALAGDWEVARMTSDIPHPLSAEQAKDWLSESGKDIRFAIEFGSTMIGSAGYFRRRSGAAELGFWLGRGHWGVGFGTEAAAAVVKYGLATGQSVFSSAHFVDNPASGRVLAKLGFRPTSRCAMWCSARGVEVDAIGLILERARAEEVLGPVDPPVVQRTARPGRLGRWFNTVQR